MPVHTRAFVQYDRRGALARLAEIFHADITHHDRDLVRGTVGHKVGKKSYRIGERALGRFEPNDVRGYLQQIGIPRKSLHDWESRSRKALSLGSFRISVAWAAASKSSRMPFDKSAS